MLAEEAKIELPRLQLTKANRQVRKENPAQ